MTLDLLIRRWGVFAMTVFFLIGLSLANLKAGPVAEHDVVMRYAFWMVTAVAAFLSWFISHWLVVLGRERLSRSLLVASSLAATLLFVPWSLMIDLLFGMADTDANWFATISEEWLVSALPVFSSSMIASLPAWLSTTDSRASSAGTDATRAPPSDPTRSLLPVAVRGGVLRATADLQYVHLHSLEGVTTVPGPMRRVMERLSDKGMEVRRGEWIADRHVKQVKSVRGRWVVLLKDGQQVAVSRRRLADVKRRWGTTRYV